MHGISTENVQISEAVEIMVYCLMDGKVDQKSTFESQLYEQLNDQMMDAFLDGVEDIFEHDALRVLQITQLGHQALLHLRGYLKTIKDIAKQTSALVWLYLNIIGKPADQFLNHSGLFDFLRKDFKSAVACLILDDDGETDPSAINMKELISKHFKNERELTDWSKDIFKQVTLLQYGNRTA